ncbi:MAG: hypothetical protein RL302_1361, partial [Pseudomonadota bacterium]
YTLRLPDALDAAARAKADYLGISLNALLCVALDAYLRNPVDLQTPTAGAAPPPNGGRENPSKTKVESQAKPPTLTRAQKQAAYERDKADRKRLTGG